MRKFLSDILVKAGLGVEQNAYVLGNVGVGTTSPTRPLYVVSTQWDNTSGGGAIFENNNSVGAGITLKPTASSVTNGSNGWAVYAGGPGAAIGDGNLGFWAHGTNEARVAIQRGGNVGIGTTGPVSPLDVNGIISSRGIFIAQNSGTYNLIYNASNSVAMYIGGSADPATYYDNLYHYFRSNSGSTTYGVWNSTGLGIGTSSPSQKLVVIGNAAISGVVYTDYVQTYSGTSIDFRHQDASVVMRVDTANAAVGIGTTSPAAKLDVIGKGVFGTMASSRGAYSNGLSLQNNTGELTSLFLWQSGVASAHIGSPANNTSLYIVNSYNTGLITDPNSIVLTNTGNVGIGTTSPGAKLHLYGSGATELRIGSSTGNTNSLLSFYEVGIASWGIDAGQANGSFFIKDLYNTRTVVTLSNAGNVGIGTTSPTRKLDVNGTSIFRDFTTVVATNGNPVSNITWLSTDSGIMNIYTGGSATVQLNSNGVSYFNGGNVGIGTTNPISGQGTPLTLASSTGYVGLTLSGSGAYSHLWQLYASGDGGSNKFFGIYDSTNATYRLVTTSGGNVGIGTSSPGAKLQIAGGTLDGTSLTDLGISSGLTTGRLGTFDASSLASISTRGDASSVELAAGSSATYYTGISATANNATSFTGTLRFFTSGSEKVRITPSGNVGIGTSSPSTLLDVRGEVSVAYNATYGLRFYNDARNNWSFIGNSVSGSSSANLRFGDATGEVMRITGGTIGIGTSSPTAKLDVQGNPGLVTINTNGALSAGGQIISGAGEFASSSSGTDLNFRAGATHLMVLKTSGNVGIGTTSPSAKLDVNGSIYAVGDIAIRQSGSSSLSLYRANSGYQSATLYWEGSGLYWAAGMGYSTYNWVINDTNYGVNNKFVVTQGTTWGVGIGTASPTGKLHVGTYGTVGPPTYSTANGDGLLFDFFNSGSPYTRFGRIVSSAGDASEARLNFFTKDVSANPTEKLTILGNGNVGIGTTSPTEKLHVVGNIFSTGNITVSGNINANDYLQTYGLFYHRSNFNVINKAVNGWLTWATRDTSEAETTIQLNYVRSINAAYGGNVGIGTTSPAAPLHVYKSDTYSAIISRADWNIAETRLGLGAQYGVLGYISTGIVETINDTTYVALNYKNGLSTYAEGLRVYNNGNVGIGTTAPSYKLDVVGEARFGSNYKAIVGDDGAYGGYSTIGFGGTTNGYNRVFGATGTSDGLFLCAATGRDINFRPNGGTTDVFVIGANGYLYSNSYLFAYEDGSYNRFYRPNGTVGIYLGASDAGNYYDNTTHYFRNSGGGANYAIIDSNGNVGIGTTSPAQKLDVIGTIRSQVTSPGAGNGDVYAFAVHEYNGNNGRMGLGLHDTGDAFLGLYSDTGVTTRIDSNGSSYFMGGNVGIGTTSPGGKLDVVIAGGNVTTYDYGLDVKVSTGGGWARSYRLYNSNYTAGTTFWGTFGGGSSVTYSYWTIGDPASIDITGFNTSNGIFLIPSGNVGIGTTSPSDKLQVQSGNLSLYSNSYGNTGLIRHFGTDNGEKYQQGLTTGGDFYQYTFSGLNHIFYTNNGFERMRITSAGNVGIGTTSPSDKLQVAGGILSSYGSTNGYIALQAGNSSVQGYVEWFKPGPTRVGYMGYNDGSTANNLGLNLENSANFVINGGNVGIGTTSPATKLQVNGTFASNALWTDTSSIAYWGNYSTAYGALTWDTGYAMVFSTGGNALRFGTNGTATRMTIDTSGNVGIGTTSPSYQFDITTANYKSFRIQSSDDALITIGSTVASSQFYSIGASGIGSGQGSNLFWIGRSTNNPSGLLTKDFVINSSGNVGIGTTSPSYKLDVATGNDNAIRILNSLGSNNNGFALAVGSGTPWLDFYGGRFDIKYNTSPGSWNSGSDIFLSILSSGNVGIGTTNPAAKFQVTDASSSITLQNYLNGAAIFLDGVNGDFIGGDYFHILADGSSYLGVGGYAGGATPLNVSNNGNVGIGTTSPTEKLHVSGNIVLGSTANGYQEAGSKYIGLSYPSLGTDGYVGFQFESVNAPAPYNGNYSQNIKFYTHHYAAATGGTPRMTIQYDGNVGIGTTSPGFKLTVAGGSGDWATKFSSGTASAYFAHSGGYGASIDAGSNATSSTYLLELISNGSTRVYVRGDGNVGIGTTSPNTKFNIQEINSGTEGLIITNWNSVNTLLLGSDSSTGGGKITLRTNGGTSNVFISSYGISHFNGGNVGIGTDSPASKLDLYNGTDLGLGANGIRVQRPGAYGQYGYLEYLPSSDVTVLGSLYTGGGASVFGQIYFRQHSSTTSRDIMVINSSGNVGIGTTSPSQKLETVGIIKSSGVSNSLMFENRSASGNTWEWYSQGSVGSSFAGLYKNYNTAETVLAITDTGNVGIGTTSPVFKLDVNGNTRIGGISSSNTARLNVGGVANEWVADFQASSTTNQSYGLVVRAGTSSTDFPFYVLNSSSANAFFAIKGDGNVGIGTTSPGAKLTILAASTGYSSDSQIKISDSTTSYYGGLSFDDAGATRLSIRNSYDGTGSIIGFGFGSSADKVQIIDGTGLIVNEGNVGIGTTSPNARLTVVANDSSNPNVALRLSSTGYSGVPYPYTSIRFGSAYSSYPSWNLASIDAGYTGSSWGGSLLFYTNNDSAETNLTERMRITSGGNVGIGTTSPSEKLTVAGDIGIYENGANRKLYISNSAGSTTVQVSPNGASYFNGGDVGIGTTSPVAQLSIFDTNNSRAYQMSFGYGSTETFRLGNTNSTGKFTFTQLNNNNGFRFTSTAPNATGIIFDINTSQFAVNGDTGNVGIGTTSPLSPLHQVAGGGNYTGEARFGGSSTAFGIELKYTQAGSTLGSIYTSPTYSSADILFKLGAGLGNENQLVLKGNGNVGIGTTSPNRNLTVSGNGTLLGLQSNTAGGYSEIEMTANGTSGGYIFKLSAGNSIYAGAGSLNIYNSNSIGFHTAAVTNAMFIASANGSVGIGTTSPAAKLDIVGSDGFRTSSDQSTSAFVGIVGTASEGRITVSSYGSFQPMTFYTGGSERMRITSGGNVGIGTSSPTYILDTYGGEVRFKGSSTYMTVNIDNNSTSGGGGIYLRQNGTIGAGIGLSGWYLGGTSSDLFLNSESGRNIRFAVNAGTEAMRITSGGNVGIGTASPSERLEVNGSIRLSDGNADGPQLKLASSGYSDWNIDNYNGSLRAYYGSTEYTRLTSSGYFGIGTSSPSYKLHVEGNVSGISIYASHDIAAFSDITVKKDVERIENAIEKVKELNGYTYVRTDDETGTRRAGVIAQEVQKVLPEVVSQNPDGTLNVAYANMIALLIEGMKEQQVTIERLEDRIKQLEK